MNAVSIHHGGRRPRLGAPVAAAGIALAIMVGALIALPLAGVFSSFVHAQASLDTLAHLSSTVIPRAVRETAILATLVTLGVIVLGTTSAWLVAALDFPGRRFFEWAMLLPLAMPAYIVAYAYTDFLQYAGPLQTWLRELFGWQRGDYWFPQIRSVGGAAFVFTVVFYPYVYLLARTAFLARTASMIDAARSLGLSPLATWLRVDLPLARPAVAAGALLALMETIADYGAVSYFGLDTFTTAIYRAWFSHGDRLAASQMAAMLLVIVLGIIAFEERTRGRARYFAASGTSRPAPRAPLRGAPAVAAVIACCIPIALGFALPVAILVDLMWPGLANAPLTRYAEWVGNTVVLAALAAMLTIGIALLIAYAVRLAPAGASATAVRGAARLLSLGYAVPGAVIAVGILIPLARFDNAVDAWMKASFGIGTGLLLTGTVAALLYAFVVRYFAVAQQPIHAGLARITPAMDDSARSLGAGPLEVFWRVHLPLLAPSVVAGALFVFVDVMKELPATLVLRPFDFDTLAVIAYQYAKDERLGEAALPSLTIVLAGVVPVMLLSRAIGRASSFGA